MVSEFEKRRHFIVERLNRLPGVSCMKPRGAFYVFPNVSGTYGKSAGGHGVENSASLTAYLLDVAEIAVVPGVEFGSDDNIRLSYATSMNNIERGLERMEKALGALR